MKIRREDIGWQQAGAPPENTHIQALVGLGTTETPSPWPCPPPRMVHLLQSWAGSPGRRGKGAGQEAGRGLSGGGPVPKCPC